MGSKIFQHKNLKNKNIKVYSASGDIIPESVLGSTECEGMDVTVENPQYSFQVETNRCNLLQDGELVIESDTEDTEVCFFIYLLSPSSCFIH